MSPVRIASNFDHIDRFSTPSSGTTIRVISAPDSWNGARKLLRDARDVDVLLLNIDGGLLERLCMLRAASRFERPKIVAVDLLLNAPTSFRQRLRAKLRRWAFRQVDRFVHYFKDTRGYDRYYGLGDRSTYVPFKCNLWHDVKQARPDPTGDYVLAAGRSLRDYPTFLAAIRAIKRPARIVLPPADLLKAHGSAFDVDRPPENVEFVIEDGSMKSWAEHIKRARVVVIPVQAGAIRSCGISMCLDAMGLGKAVIITEGPTTAGIFTDEVVSVPPTDPTALARAIQSVWDDEALRNRLAQKSRHYAEKVQGEDRLYRDLIEVAREVAARG